MWGPLLIGLSVGLSVGVVVGSLATFHSCRHVIAAAKERVAEERAEVNRVARDAAGLLDRIEAASEGARRIQAEARRQQAMAAESLAVARSAAEGRPS